MLTSYNLVMDNAALLFLLPLIGSGIGTFLVSYLKKKGENLATHEDIKMLVGQMAAVTQATKQIEASIADDFWGKQKRWELQRDVLLAALDHIANFQGETNKLTAMASVGRNQDPQKRAEVEEAMRSIARGLVEQTPRLMAMSYRVALVSVSTLQQSFTRIQKMLFFAQEQINQRNVEAAITLGTEVEGVTYEILAAIRAELGFPNLAVTSQLSESSAAQALGSQAAE
jgi:hypothetical protein